MLNNGKPRMMWVVRNPGGHHADEMVERGIVSIGWSDLGDLSRCLTPEDFYDAVRNAYPQISPQGMVNAGRQLYKFFHEMKHGDHVVTYDSSKRIYHLGTIIADAKYDANASTDYLANQRAVSWIRTVSRDGLSVPARNSLGSTLTIFQPSLEAQEELLSENPPTAGPTDEPASDFIPVTPAADVETEDPLENALESSKELIKDKMIKLSWQDMQRLVAGLLRAMGYKTKISADGADRGKDIIASPDALMLEHPRIFVEVKHRSGAMGAPEVRKFIGGRDPANDRCVYVSTGGFTREAKYEAERSRVPTTLVDSDELVDLLIAHYDEVDAETRALLPLRKTYWPI
jgi:restriction system protein